MTSAKSCQHAETQLLCSRPREISQLHSQMIVIQLISFIRSQFPWLPFVKPLNARAGTNKYTSNFSNQITMVVIFSWQKVKTKVYKWPECRRVYCSTLLHLQLVDDKPIQFLSTFWELKKMDGLSRALFEWVSPFWALFLRLLVQHNKPLMPSSVAEDDLYCLSAATTHATKVPCFSPPSDMLRRSNVLHHQEVFSSKELYFTL